MRIEPGSLIEELINRGADACVCDTNCHVELPGLYSIWCDICLIHVAGELLRAEYGGTQASDVVSDDGRAQEDA